MDYVAQHREGQMNEVIKRLRSLEEAQKSNKRKWERQENLKIEKDKKMDELEAFTESLEKEIGKVADDDAKAAQFKIKARRQEI